MFLGIAQRLFLFLVIACSLAATCSESAVAADRPNILFCFADDWGRYASAYREGADDQTPNAVVSTPNFDRIAQEGALFNNAFVTSPSCTPCRSSLLSGQYFFRTGLGAILQGAVWDLAIPSYPLILQDHGYHIGHTYKVWSPGRPPNAPYGGWKTSSNKAGVRFNRFSQVVSAAADPDQAKKQLYDEVRNNFRNFIATSEPGKPFCYWFGPTNTHRTWTQGSGKDLWGLNPDDLKGKMPPFLPDNELVREDFCDYLGEAQAFDAAVGVLLAELERIDQLDNTLIVVSGDHGIPGFPRGKCNLYDFGVKVALAVRWGKHVPAGRTVDDFVNLMDLAPTFLECGGVTPPKVMTGQSFLDVLTSKKQGQVDAQRDFVVTGRERHVAAARKGMLPYPHRAIHTKDFLYIRNFKPTRWPMGVAPGFGLPAGPMPSYEALENNTFAAFADFDASPTKAWIATHRNDPGMRGFFDFAFGRRPGEELYDLQKDPHQTNNVAENPSYASTRKQLATRLMSVLTAARDPRVLGVGDTFDQSPYTDAPPTRRRRTKPAAKPSK